MSQNVRRIIYTGAFAGIAASGAIYGAQLKTVREADEAARSVQKKETQKYDEVIPQLPITRSKIQAEPKSQQDEALLTAKRIATLQGKKTELERQKNNLERRLSELQARQEANESSILTTQLKPDSSTKSN